MGIFDDDDDKPAKEKGEKTYTMKEIKDLFKIFKDAVKK